MPRHIKQYAAFFAVIDRNFANAAEVTQARLVELHGAEGLRYSFQAVAFLGDWLALEWHADAVGAATDRQRVKATIAAAGEEPWAPALEAYWRHLAAGRKLAPGTTRMYVAAAAALLRASSVKQKSELTQQHLTAHLRRSRGRRNNLLSFLSWVAATSGQRLDPGQARRTSAKKREKATLKTAAILLNRLEAAGSAQERRALLAAATSVLHGMPLSETLALHQSNDPRKARLTSSAFCSVVKASDLLASKLDATTTETCVLQFPGRNGLQPLSTSAVRHHTRSPPGTR